ncbi:MAG: hypothetical protein ABI411_04125 [Tahibacter sp.]
MLTIVLLPGMVGTGDLFQPFVDALDARVAVQIIRYPMDPTLGYAALEQQVREALPCDRPYVLLAESFSGPIAVSIAASRPHGLCGLVLCCTFVRNPRPWLAPFAGLIEYLPLDSPSSTVANFLLYGNFSTHRLRALANRVFAAVPGPVLRARLRAVVAVDVLYHLAACAIPVLYLRATRDRLVPPSSAGDLIANAVPGAAIAHFDGPHGLLQVCPAPTAAAVVAFCKTLNHPDPVAI